MSPTRHTLGMKRNLPILVQPSGIRTPQHSPTCPEKSLPHPVDAHHPSPPRTPLKVGTRPLNHPSRLGAVGLACGVPVPGTIADHRPSPARPDAASPSEPGQTVKAISVIHTADRRRLVSDEEQPGQPHARHHRPAHRRDAPPAGPHPATTQPHQRVPRPDWTHPRTRTALTPRPRHFKLMTGWIIQEPV